MFPDELIQILQKYKEETGLLYIEDLNKNFKRTIKLLKDLRNHLADKQYDINTSDYLSDKSECDVLSDDISLLKQQIQYYIKLQEATRINTDFTTETSEEIMPTSLVMPKPVKLYLCEDNVCPSCNSSMDETYTRYKENNTGSFVTRTIDTYRCDCCNRFFVCDYVINNIDLENTNLIIDRKFYNKIPPIDIRSVLVLKSTLKCFSHRTETFLAQIPILDEDGNIFYHSLDASYCFECNRYTILEDDFNAIKDIILCKIVDDTYINNQESSNNFNIEKDCSVLKYYGYNVQTKKSISKQQRHIILSSLIESGIMSRRQVIDHIKVLIQRGSKIPSWREATQKWKDDIEFVNTYKIEDLPKVVFDKIVLKYKKSNQ